MPIVGKMFRNYFLCIFLCFGSAILFAQKKAEKIEPVTLKVNPTCKKFLEKQLIIDNVSTSIGLLIPVIVQFRRPVIVFQINTMSTEDHVQNYSVKGKELNILVYASEEFLATLSKDEETSIQIGIYYSFSKKDTKELALNFSLSP